nr:MAG TPA: hypothetical protein [Caudoviricetes sp.]
MPGQKSSQWKQSKKYLEVLCTAPPLRENFPRGLYTRLHSALAGCQATVFLTVHRLRKE